MGGDGQNITLCAVLAAVPNDPGPGAGRATPGIDHGRCAPGSGRPRERDAPCSPGVGHTPGIATTPGSPGGAHPGERDPRGSPRWGHLGGKNGKPNQNRQNHYHNRQKLAKSDRKL